MMNAIRIDLEGTSAREPGDEIRGTVHWTLSVPPTSIQTRLFWYTEGKGDRDLSVAQESSTETTAASGSTSFTFRLPAGPYSFSGKLISLIWAIEAIAAPSGETARVELTIGPDGREARIDTGGSDPAPEHSVI